MILGCHNIPDHVTQQVYEQFNQQRMEIVVINTDGGHSMDVDFPIKGCLLIVGGDSVVHGTNNIRSNWNNLAILSIFKQPRIDPD